MNVNYLISIIYFTFSILLFFLGLIIFRENPKGRINRITAILLFLATIGGIMGASGLLIKQQQIDLNVVERFFGIWEFFFPQLVLFALIFPIERSALKRNPKKIPFLIYLPHIFQFILLLIFNTPQQISSFAGAFEISVFQGVLKPLAIIFQLLIELISLFHAYHANFFAVLNLVYVVAAIYLMYSGYKLIKSERVKKQVALVLWGIRSSVGLYAIAFLIPKIFPLRTPEYLTYTLTVLALSIGAGSIAWAIIKYQFLDIRFFLRKSIIFSMVSAILIGIYLLLYGHSKQMFKQVVGVEIPVLEVLFLILAAILFQPILSAIENFVEKNFIKGASDYRDVLQTLSHDILTMLDIQKLREKIVNTLTEAMILESVHLVLEDRDGNFSTEVFDNLEPKLIKFHSNNEFIQLMQSIREPIGIDEICIKISNEVEIERLKSISAYLIIPLHHRGELEGILSLGKKLTNTSFSSEDGTLLNLLSGQIAIAIENSKLYQEKLEKQRIERDISLAREIQRMLLPQLFPKDVFYEISAINIPSKEVGGDYYDFIRPETSKIGIAIGDIAGKGIPASLLMSNLQAAFRASASQISDPALVMSQVNSQITRTTSPEKYATFFYGIFDESNYIFTYANAGHNFPILRLLSGECRFLRESGLVIGIDEHTHYEPHQLQLQSGELLVFYTDGITEALSSDEREFGEERLLRIIQQYNWITTEQLRNKIYDSVIDFAKGTFQYDDLTLVIFQVK